MDAFKKASTLNDDYSRNDRSSRRGRPTSESFKSKTRKCEHNTSGLCGVSREAFDLGLREDVFPCTGNIPPDCVIRQSLAAGITLQELFKQA